MKKDYRKIQTRHLIYVLVITLVIWFWGAFSFTLPTLPGFSWLPNVMGKAGTREDLFAPVGTFFSGLSAIATAYLIWLQLKTMRDHDQEVETDRVISHFFMLLELHRNILKTLKYPYDNLNTEYIYGHNAIEYYLKTIQCVMTTFCPNFTYKKTPLDELSTGIVQDINELQSSESPDNKYTFKIEDATSTAFRIIHDHTEHCLEQYFHNIYIMLKLLDENRDNLNIKDYMRTLRAELTQDEFLLIYYHAYNHEDYNTGEKKFKILIEKTCFFHSLHKPFLDIDPQTHKHLDLYDPSAFEH